MSEKIRIITVDDHPLVREGIAAILAIQPDMLLVDQVADGASAILAYRRHRPDVLLMDLRLPDMSGSEATAQIRHEFPKAKIVILTTFGGDIEIQRALSAGARGYVLKTMPPQEVVDAIRKVHGGGKYVPLEVVRRLAEHYGEEGLSQRELEVLRCFGEGLPSRAIADQLSISKETVAVHMRKIMNKLHVHDRTGAVATALRRGIIHL